MHFNAGIKCFHMLYINLKFDDASDIYGCFSEKNAQFYPKNHFLDIISKMNRKCCGGFACRVRVQVLVLHLAGADIGWVSDNLTYDR